MQAANAQLGFDIYGDASRFEIDHSVDLDLDTCEYTAQITFNAPAANLPFPPVMPGPEGPGSCTLEDASCEGQSCLYEMRNVYRFDKYFESVTGFNHFGMDWSPCGHPPLEYFARPHLNMHIFRIPPEERETMSCDMLNPFICSFPPENIQSSLSGKKYFHVAKVEGTDFIANTPEIFTHGIDTAVPGEGLHAYDHVNLVPVQSWFDPVLIIGTYDGGINFWEPMFPIEFSVGDTENFYEESPEYVSQTVTSLPSYWSMHYDPETEVTTLTMKGEAENCVAKNPCSSYSTKKSCKSSIESCIWYDQMCGSCSDLSGKKNMCLKKGCSWSSESKECS